MECVPHPRSRCMSVASDFLSKAKLCLCHFAGVDTKITNVGISVKSTGLVHLYCFVSVNYKVEISLYLQVITIFQSTQL